MYQILWQHWQQRPGRLFLTLLSLILSTATLVAILVASHNARTSFRDLNNAVQGLPSLDVVNSTGGRFERSLFDSDFSDDLVTSSLPTLIRGTILRNKELKSRAIAIGLPLAESTTSQRSFLEKAFELQPNQWPGEGECLLSELLASSLEAKEGDTLQCLFRRGFKKLIVKKVIPSAVWNRIASEHGVMVDLNWLQNVTALSGKIDRYRFYLSNDRASTKTKATELLSSHIPSSLMIKERTNSVGVADDLLKSTELGLSFASALAVAMAAYILLNTTRMNLAERRSYFAILKCLGATSKQIIRAILSEAAILSSISVLLGLILGCFLGFAMGRVLAAVLQTTPSRFSLPWIAIILVAFFIPLMTLLVTWFAQKQQDEVSPLESFREPPIPQEGQIPWQSIGIGILCWIIAIAGLFLVQQEILVAQWGVFAGLLALVSYLICLPVALIPLIWLIDRLARYRFGLPLEIAKYQIIRRPERTSLNAGFLVISLCGAVGLGQSLMSNTAEIKRWYYRALPGDLFLITTRPPSTVIDSEDPLRQMIDELPGKNWANAIRFVWCQADQQTVLAIVREFPDNAPFPTEPKGMTTTEARELVKGDNVLIGSILAKKLGKKGGDTITITVEGRSFPMRIAGVNANFANGGVSLMISRETAQRFMDVTGFEWYAISVDPAQVESAKLSFDKVKDQYGFEVQRGSEMRSGVEQAISGVTTGIWSVVFISFLTGGFGIATTLAMNMIEQARDFSLIRIVGASRWQLMLAVLVQAWLLAAIGLFFGMIGGITTVLIIISCSEALMGYQPDFQWNPSLMTFSAIGTVTIVTIAALLPAWKASQINPVEHLTYE